MFKNRNLLVIAAIAVVNALGYGIIIPILYSYSHRLGMTDFQNGLLFSLFSLCQFISTPIIGRMSDKYGRRPMLLISLAGTILSFILMAIARNPLLLFVARALDGITAGNISVASAVISDSTESKDRARGFGIIGASFGLGFVFGPAISVVTLRWGMSAPFWTAAIMTAIAWVATMAFLPETNKHQGEVHRAKILDLRKMVNALVDERVGKTLSITLLYAFAFSLFIYAYQPFAVKSLHMTPEQISLNFIVIGLVGVVAQMIIIPRVNKQYGDIKTLIVALVMAMVTFLTLGLAMSPMVFIGLSIFFALANSFVNPMTQTLLSKETDENSQGSILGVQASLASVGMIFGPLVGGVLASVFLQLPFFVGGGVVLICAVLAREILREGLGKKEKLF